MIKEAHIYYIQCDCCKEVLSNKFGAIAQVHQDDILHDIAEYKWSKDKDKHYCHECTQKLLRKPYTIN